MTIQPVPLAYDEFGEPDNVPLVILHGFFASSRNWRQIARNLSERYHVLVPDLRNHGESPHSPVMDYPAMVADMRFFLDQRGIKQVNLLGHSMGGKAAMWFALNFPEYLERLIVADISPTQYRHSFDRTIHALQQLPLQSIVSRKQADALLAASIADNSYRQFLLQNLQLKDGQYQWRVDLDIFMQTADHIISFPDSDHLRPYLGSALFLGGESSDYIKADDVYRWFPYAQIKTIPGTGHWLHAQSPAQFCQEVDIFLA